MSVETEVQHIGAQRVHDNTFHNPNYLPDDQRVPMANMPDGTAGHVLTANGVGVNPSYQAAGGGSVPSGLIMMWHGLLANIPVGYVLCDGNNGSPNLLGRFIRQVPDALTDPGSTGGSNTHTHAQHAASGDHQHAAAVDHQHAAAVDHQHAAGGGHTHTGAGGHQHTSDGSHRHNAHATGAALCGTFGDYAPLLTPNGYHSYDGSHDHNAIANHTHNAIADHQHAAAGAHQHAAAGAHQHTGAGDHQHDAHDSPSNVPLFYELAFIMKT